MNKIEKFETFLESLKGQGQDSLIESVKKGFKVCFENEESSLKDEMKSYLIQTYSGLMDTTDDGFNFDMEAAIYWFANHYHGGQWSELYSILSTSQYNPGRMVNGPEDEGESTKMMYDSLVDKYGK